MQIINLLLHFFWQIILTCPSFRLYQPIRAHPNDDINSFKKTLDCVYTFRCASVKCAFNDNYNTIIHIMSVCTSELLHTQKMNISLPVIRLKP